MQTKREFISRFGIFMIVTSILLGLTACGGDTPGGQSTTPIASGNDLNVVVLVSGKLEVKRTGWKDFAPALFGATLQLGDLLRLGPSAQAKIACADLSVVNVPQDGGALPCRTARAVLTEDGATVVAPRGSNTGGFPMVVAPRKTSLLNAHPTIRWTALDGADGYIVSVKGGDLNWATPNSVQGTELAYPQDAPALAPGQTYKVTVQAGTASSDSEGLPGLGFTMLTQDEAKTVTDSEQQIRSLGLDASAQGLLVAHLYADHSLYDEAIEQLASLPTASTEPAIQRLLGDYYLATALNDMAEASYSQALQLSQAAGDTEGQALAASALGQVYASLGDKTDAQQSLQSALTLYQQLGDTSMSDSITKQLNQLK
jgi:hypothetical protein